MELTCFLFIVICDFCKHNCFIINIAIFQAMNLLKREYYHLLEFFYPNLCVACSGRLVTQEKYLCLDCWHDLPVTNFHNEAGNRVAQLFWGRVNLESATAFFAYNKGSNYQHLVHYIKYKGMKDLGYVIGQRFGNVLTQSNAFQMIDLIVPVPLHPKKEKQRGYNQSEWIARGIAFTMGKNVITGNLVRKIHTSTQTKKNRFERWENVDDIFDVTSAADFEGKHILLVDDVVTTGSTLEACASKLLKAQGVRVSIATLAFADF